MMAGRVVESGVSLVELLVALAVGMLVLLGAGRLYLDGVENLIRVDELGERQEAVTLGALFLLRDIRRGGVEPGRYELRDATDGEGCASTTGWRENLGGRPGRDGRKLCGERADSGGCGGRAGLYRITLRPLGGVNPLVLHAMDREAAVRHAGSSSPGERDHEGKRDAAGGDGIAHRSGIAGHGRDAGDGRAAFVADRGAPGGQPQGIGAGRDGGGGCRLAGLGGLERARRHHRRVVSRNVRIDDLARVSRSLAFPGRAGQAR